MMEDIRSQDRFNIYYFHAGPYLRIKQKARQSYGDLAAGSPNNRGEIGVRNVPSCPVAID